MGCFSGRVDQVTDTKIFARPAPPDRQVLIYELKLSADKPVAMILPIPTPTGSDGHAVRFVSLDGYPEIFGDLEKAFPPASRRRPVSEALSRSRPIDTLQVHEVGAFVASFVPSIDDFWRVDPRLRVASALFKDIPEYAGWGYVVFQLTIHPGWLTRIHPMAFEFTTRSPDQVFFPTRQIHDGGNRPTAWFAHRLYAQGKAAAAWDCAAALDPAVDQHRAAGLLLDAPTWRKSLNSERPNRDIWV
jgi:hypothetical protein